MVLCRDIGEIKAFHKLHRIPDYGNTKYSIYRINLFKKLIIKHYN